MAQPLKKLASVDAEGKMTPELAAIASDFRDARANAEMKVYGAKAYTAAGSFHFETTGMEVSTKLTAQTGGLTNKAATRTPPVAANAPTVAMTPTPPKGMTPT